MLARQCGRWDWWNLRDEHTAYEWTVQRLLYLIDPFGPERDDASRAWNTVHLIANTTEGKLEESDLNDILRSLRKYLKHQNTDDFDVAALQKVKQHAEPR